MYQQIMRQQIIGAALAAVSSFALSCSLMSSSVVWADGVPGKCAQLQDAETAIASCTEFIDAHPGGDNNLAAAYFYRGTAYSSIQRFDEAIADLGKAIENDPAWPLPYNNRARAFVEKGDLVKAIADYDKLVAMNPNNVVPWVNRAVAFMKMKDFDRALADLKKADELKPNNPFVAYNIGEVYENKGDNAQAEAQYRKALSLSPGNRTVIAGLKRIGATP
jgi:tetratricopeptide (TPR) repeat protein